MRAHLAASLLLAACDLDLASITEVEDLRVLAVRAAEPELLFDGAAAATLTFEALVVDPRGGEVSYAWRFCPVESDVACADYEAQRATAPAEFRQELDDLRALASEGTALPLGPGPTYDVQSFVVAAPAGLARYHLETSLMGFGAGAWPSVTLKVRRGGDAVVAQKRAVLSLRDLASFADPFAAALGVRICTASVTQDCLAVAPRTPNQNPVFDHLEVARGERADGEFEPLSVPLELGTGESIRIRPHFTTSSFEPYQRLLTDVDTRQVFVEDAREELSVQWFATAGELQDDLTAEPLSRTLDTAFEAPERPGLVTVWLVARDGRGGVAWTSLELTITG